MIINPDHNTVYVVMKYLEVYNTLYDWMSSEIHTKLKQIDEDAIDTMPDKQLKMLEGINIREFVPKFYTEIKP